MDDYAKPEYKSALADHMNNLLAEKRSLGFKYNDEARFMKQFDQYWLSKNYDDDLVTYDRLHDWMIKRETESNRSHNHRIAVTRQLLKYMVSIGIPAFVPDNDIHYSRPLIRVLSEEELQELFRETDAITAGHPVNFSLLFRLILCLGLRNSEGRFLCVNDFDFDKGVIVLHHTKGDKERRLYPSF